MKISLCLAWQSIKLYSRTIGYFYTMILTPLLLFFVYTGIFAGGERDRVLAFMGPILVLMATMNGLYGIGGDLLMMRETGTLLPYKLTPVTGVHIIASRLLIDVAITIFVGALDILLAIAVFHVPLRASPTDLVIISILGALALGTLGALIIEIANSFPEASMLSQALFLVLLILSGLTMPLASLPHFAQVISRFLPTTMLVASFDGILTQGHHLSQYWREITVLVLFIISTGIAAAVLFRWDKDQKVRWRARAIAAASLAPLVIAGVWFNLA
jgi:ABC-type multidrug transport system permease subunit